MLRLTIILIGIGTGVVYSLKSPFYALIVYIVNAYFRPEDWVPGDDFIRSLRLSFLIGMCVIFSILLRRQKLVWNGSVSLLCLFVTVALVSTVNSNYPEYCWPYTVELLKMIIILIIVVLTAMYSKFRLLIIVIVLTLGSYRRNKGGLYLITSPGSVKMKYHFWVITMVRLLGC